MFKMTKINLVQSSSYLSMVKYEKTTIDELADLANYPWKLLHLFVNSQWKITSTDRTTVY